MWKGAPCDAIAYRIVPADPSGGSVLADLSMSPHHVVVQYLRTGEQYSRTW
jgi:hypothetical protein